MSPPHCRFCDTPLSATLIDLGVMPLANSYVGAEDVAAGRDPAFPLHARVCDRCFLVQVDHCVPAEAIFSDYAYFSSYSESWVAHAGRYAKAIIERFQLGPQSQVVEVASNDGYLLQHFKANGIPVLGVEPAANVAEAAVAKGIPTEVAFFGEETARALAARGYAADLIAANNVLAHVPNIRDFLAGFAQLLKPEGVVTFEFPHILNLLREVQFDTIYHEHFFYLSLFAVERILASTGLRAFDVELLPTHGGSLRLFVCHNDAAHSETPAIKRLRQEEYGAQLDAVSGYAGFATKAQTVKSSFLSFLAQAKTGRKRIAAYGAAAKGNTFLNYCGVDHYDIVCVFDRNPVKQGRLLPGSHIPVRPPEELSRVRPDYLLILPWNLAAEIRSSMAVIEQWGGQFVAAIPETRVL